MIKAFWENFCQINNLKNTTYTESFCFGVEPDLLANLVLENKKRATSSAYIEYEINNEQLPKIGEYSIVLNSQEIPVAIIQVIDVDICKFNQVSEQFALMEGEGSYLKWKKDHQLFFQHLYNNLNIEYSDDLLVVLMSFKKVYPI